MSILPVKKCRDSLYNRLCSLLNKLIIPINTSNYVIGILFVYINWKEVVTEKITGNF